MVKGLFLHSFIFVSNTEKEFKKVSHDKAEHRFTHDISFNGMLERIQIKLHFEWFAFWNILSYSQHLGFLRELKARQVKASKSTKATDG